MKLFAAHLSPTLAAALAAATISLSVFLLPGAGIQGGATPLLPAFGAAAGRVPANLPAVVHARRSRPVVHRASLPVVRVSTPAPRVVSRQVTAAPKPRPVRPHVRVRRVEHPVVVAAAAPVTQVVTPLSAPSTARGHDHRQHPVAATPRAHGHGRAPGQATPRGHGRGLGHEKHSPAAPAPAPIAAPPGNGHGNGNGNGNGGNGNGNKKGER
jgi:hypothetical protein